MAQRVLDFKKETWFTVANMDSNLLNSCCVHRPVSVEQVGEPPTNFSKRWGGGVALTESQLLEGICWERGADFILVGGGRGVTWGLQLSRETKSKYQNLNI